MDYFQDDGRGDERSVGLGLFDRDQIVICWNIVPVTSPGLRRCRRETLHNLSTCDRYRSALHMLLPSPLRYATCRSLNGWPAAAFTPSPRRVVKDRLTTRSPLLARNRPLVSRRLSKLDLLHKPKRVVDFHAKVAHRGHLCAGSGADQSRGAKLTPPGTLLAMPIATGVASSVKG